MNLFRNISIKTRLVFAFLISAIFPLVVFGYVTIENVTITKATAVLFIVMSIFIAIITALLVAFSIISPLQIAQSSIQAFQNRKTATPIKDKGNDEINEIICDINALYENWNKEVISLGKRQLKLDKENEQTNQRNSEMESQIGQTRSLLKVAQELNTTFDFQTNCKTILDEAVRALNIQWASILLLDPSAHDLKVACVRGVERSLLEDLSEDNYPSVKLKPNEGIAGLVIKERLPLIANKGHKDPRYKNYNEFSNRDKKIASLLCVPIISKNDNILGIINFVNRQIPPIFKNEDIPYAQDLATLASLVIDRNIFYNELFTDDITGLSAHNMWTAYLKEELARAQRYEQTLSLVTLDVDNFDNIAQSTNADFVANLLGAIGKKVSSLLRDSDKATSNQQRFTCLLPNTDTAGAVFFAGRVKEALENQDFTFGNNRFKITFSAGIATFPDNTSEAKELLQNSKSAIVEAHKAGGNRACIYSN